MIYPDKMNPFAVGHLINHPPPDTPANVKLMDFDMPATFFPSYMARYMPYLDSHDENLFKRNVNETRTKDIIRAVAVVSLETMAHGDELFVDYGEDERAEIDFTPDWLIKPPPGNPYLQKKKMVTYVPFLVKALIAWDQSKKGRTFEEFQGRTMKELPRM